MTDKRDLVIGHEALMDVEVAAQLGPTLDRVVKERNQLYQVRKQVQNKKLLFLASIIFVFDEVLS